ncbi:hypothetical protein DW020_17035 [Clostridium sp. AF37-5AT]|nr:hypothetical protein DW020_17035 [Clostridium sp. AF37-5AT]
MQLGISKSVSKKQKESALIMRKQTKIAAVVSAAALLALGASMTSFAASKGTWMMVDGEWYCYDKNGDAYTNVFCSSNGKEYYVGDDGQLVRSEWVEYDGNYYFVNSSGAKITNDWRLTTPYDDESADEEWYYFKSNGKRAENEKITYKGKSYYFDTDGKMLTGWVNTGDGTSAVNEANGYEAGHTFYCDETGARVEGAWVKDVAPGVSDDDADEDEYWYYLKKATGKPATGKQSNINGQIYLFNGEGQMQHGWVAATSSDEKFVQLDKEDEEQKMSAAGEADVYYCGDEDDGHAKKNKWVKTWLPSDTNEEEDDKEWFWFDKEGKVFRASETKKNSVETAANAEKYKLDEGTLTPDDGKVATLIGKKKVNSKDYWFRNDGVMLSKFYKINDAMFYFGGADDGSMKTGSQSIKDNAGDTYKFYFYTKDQTTDKYQTPKYGKKLKKGAGVVGNQSNKLYYYGLLLTADDYKYQVVTLKDNDGQDVKFIINSNGSIQHSYGTTYKEDGQDLIVVDEVLGKEYKDSEGKKQTGTAKYVEDGQYKYGFKSGVENKVSDVDLTKFYN